MFPDDDENRGPVSLDLDTFLNSRHLQSVENLHIVMKLFWMPDLDAFGDLQGAPNERAHPYILQRILEKLKDAKAGRDGPLLRYLTLEDLSGWRPNGRRNTKRENECLAQYTKMGQDAGFEILQWKSPSGSGHSYIKSL